VRARTASQPGLLGDLFFGTDESILVAFVVAAGSAKNLAPRDTYAALRSRKPKQLI